MTNRRTAAIAGGVAAGVVVAGAVGRSVVRRRHLTHDAGEWSPPPDDLGPVVSFDGTEIAVRAAGPDGAPVVLFSHGFSLDMSTWHRQWLELSGEFRCVLMDHRGHGLSGPPAHGDLSIRSMGRDVAAVVETVAADRPCVVVGHSMGAMAVLALAEQRQELLGSLVSGVVLVSGAASDLLRGAMGSITDLVRPRIGGVGAAARRMDRLRRVILAAPADLRGAVVRLTQLGPDAPQPVVDHVVRLAEQASSQVWTDGLAELMDMDLRHAVPRVRVPALVVVGEHDRVTPPAVAIELTGRLPQGRLDVIQGAGHMPMLERPEDVNRELSVFARSVLSTPASGRRRRTRRADEASSS
jgi:pimeloyl-ACP methyl ester carboxylesterase